MGVRGFLSGGERRTLLAEFWLALLHRGHDHVADTGIGKAIEMRAKAKGLYYEKRFCTAVVCAVEDCTDG
jgi:hypothetical protein